MPEARTDTPTGVPTLVELDPHQLTVHPSNPRTATGQLTGLVASIKELGVLVPLIVTPNPDGGWHILAGQRRHLAALEAECATVPCVVRPDLSEVNADQLLAAVVDNLQRQDLKPAEEARAYQQLAAFGLSATAIAKRTGTKTPRVKDALTVAANQTAVTVADRYDLTLDQALVLAEFSDDHDAVKALTVTARRDPAGFDHLASQLRHEREREAAYSAALDVLAAAGITVIENAPSHDSRDLTQPQRLHRLTHDGQDLTPETHAACPGHAAHLDRWRPDHPTYMCTHPKTHGHTLRSTQTTTATGTSETAEDAEQRKAERRMVIENNAAWRAAEPVRRQYIRDLLARKTTPKGTLRYLTVELITHPDLFGGGPEDLIADLTGTAVKRSDHWHRTILRERAEHTPDVRLSMVLLAQHAADREHAMSVQTWRQRDDRAARWLAYLVATGYHPAPIEQHIIDTSTTAERRTKKGATAV